MRTARRCQFLILIVAFSLPLPARSAEDNVWTSLGPEGGTIKTLTMDSRNPSTLYAVAGERLFKTTDGAANWKRISIAATVVAVDPQNSDIVYAGTPNGGVWKSSDGGATWTAANAGLPKDHTHVNLLVIDPQDTRILYAAIAGCCPSLAGLFKSDNGGATWHPADFGLRQSPGPSSIRINALAVSAQDSWMLYAGTPYGVYKTVDGGETWDAMNSGLVTGGPDGNSLWITAVVIDPQTTSTVYVAKFSGVFKTSDGGASWSLVNSGLPTRPFGGFVGVSALAIDGQNPNVLYAATGRCDPCFDTAVFKSIDGAASWTSAGLANLGPTVFAIDAANEGTLYAGSANGIFKSADGGTNWKASNTGLVSSSITSIAVNSIGTIYAAASGKVVTSTDSGKHWIEVYSAPVTDDGHSIYPASQLAIDSNNPSDIYIGIGGNGDGGGGVFRTQDAGATWTRSPLPKPGGVRGLAVDTQTSGIVYAWDPHGSLARSDDRGATWKEIAGWDERASGGPLWCFDLPQSVAVAPRNPTTLYVGTTCPLGAGFVKSADGGRTWTASLTTPLIGITAVAVDPQDSDTVYVSASRTGLYKTTNGGESWTSINFGLPQDSDGYYAVAGVLAIDPRNSNTLYAALGHAGVFKSDDGGMSWTAINSGLPDVNVQSLTIDSRKPNTVYAGTTVAGIFGITLTPAQ